MTQMALQHNDLRFVQAVLPRLKRAKTLDFVVCKKRGDAAFGVMSDGAFATASTGYLVRGDRRRFVVAYGICHVRCGEKIRAGDELATSATGEAVRARPGMRRLGFSLEIGRRGWVISMMSFCLYAQGKGAVVPPAHK
jgi:hypothetical protein